MYSLRSQLIVFLKLGTKIKVKTKKTSPSSVHMAAISSVVLEPFMKTNCVVAWDAWPSK